MDDNALRVSTVDQQSAGHMLGITDGAFLKDTLFTNIYTVLTSTHYRWRIHSMPSSTADQSSHTHNVAVSASSRVAMELHALTSLETTVL